MQIGTVEWVSGPVVRAELSAVARMLEQVEVGPHRLVGEVIRLQGATAVIQVYEETSGLRPGDPVHGQGLPLSVELGPGLLGGVFDGIQRPLDALAARTGAFITRGVSLPALDPERRWPFEPLVEAGQEVRPGQVLGTLPETPLLTHRVLVPPDFSGSLSWVAPPGEYTVTEPVARLAVTDGREVPLCLAHHWPIRRKRPVARRLAPSEPLLTGQRAIDALFPLAKGGTAAVPGGFGAGKTVLQHALAKWSDADVVIYIGCGERGNEMTDVLTAFPQLEDPHTGHSLIERTILIANTSNMPVAAREASIYTGITLAEYYRDMGYHVALMADSTSRWAEALREVSGRLEEMPAEEGFPAYLPSRLASFYERAGLVNTLSGARGSVTVVGAVSPPSGDFSEPVTQHTRRYIRAFWALDKNLAAARHFPSINWLDSYSGYVDDLDAWWRAHVADDWPELRAQAMALLQLESELDEIVKLVGPDALPDAQRYALQMARLVREAFLQQNAMDPVDAYSTPEKQAALLRLLLYAHERGRAVIALGAPAGRLRDEVTVWPQLVRAKAAVPNDDLGRLDALRARLDDELERIAREYRP